ncbi:hypothetical protein BT69DRAFT_1353128 [Atractiella rhizophila]|nr:hypothetical protein BT69DRAFT_1353128 [Atractiella rhizophila]
MPQVTIHNKTKKVLNIAFSQVCPLYHENSVGPTENLVRNVGSVWFTIECKVDNGSNRYSVAESTKSIALVCTASLSVAALAFSAALPTAAIGGATLGAKAAFWAFQGATRLAPILWPAAIKQICKDHGIDADTTDSIVNSVTSAAGAAIVYTNSQRDNVMTPGEKERQEKVLEQARNKFRSAVKALTAIGGMETLKRIVNDDRPIVTENHSIPDGHTPTTDGKAKGKGKESVRIPLSPEERRKMEIEEIQRRWKEVEEQAVKDKERRNQERLKRAQEESERKKREKEDKEREKAERKKRKEEARSQTSAPSSYIAKPPPYSSASHARSSTSILNSPAPSSVSAVDTYPVLKKKKTMFKMSLSSPSAKTWRPTNRGYGTSSTVPSHIFLSQPSSSPLPSSTTNAQPLRSSTISKPRTTPPEEISISAEEALDWAEFELSEINEARVASGSQPLPPKPEPPAEAQEEGEEEKRFKAADIAAFASAFIAKTSSRMNFKRNISRYPKEEEMPITAPQAQPSLEVISQVPDNAELRVYCVYMGWGKERVFSIREKGTVFALWDDLKDEEIC